MNIDAALDILKKCCENIDIDDNGHERECGKCEVCRALYEVDDSLNALRASIEHRSIYGESERQTAEGSEPRGADRTAENLVALEIVRADDSGNRRLAKVLREALALIRDERSSFADATAILSSERDSYKSEAASHLAALENVAKLRDADRERVERAIAVLRFPMGTACICSNVQDALRILEGREP